MQCQVLNCLQKDLDQCTYKNNYSFLQISMPTLISEILHGCQSFFLTSNQSVFDVWVYSVKQKVSFSFHPSPPPRKNSQIQAPPKTLLDNVFLYIWRLHTKIQAINNTFHLAWFSTKLLADKYLEIWKKPISPKFSPWVTMTEYLLAISIQYYKQTSDENKENHQFQDYPLIQYQIL